MTSHKSIDSCSLGCERSTSEGSDAHVGSLYKETVNLSYIGAPEATCTSIVETTGPIPPNSHIANVNPVTRRQAQRDGGVDNCTRRTKEVFGDCDVDEQMTTKKPSYLGLACSISGYSGITRYDSKLREGFRSRDSSPGVKLITGVTTLDRFRSRQTLSVPIQDQPPKSHSISPLAMERHYVNGFLNGERAMCGIISNSCKGCSEVDCGISSSTFRGDLLDQISCDQSMRASSTLNKSAASLSAGPYVTTNREYQQQNKLRFSNVSSPSSISTNINVSHSSYSDTTISSSSLDLGSYAMNSSNRSEKSFIQQRVERLYGPGALAQGFFFKRNSVTRLNLSGSNCKSGDEATNKSCINNNKNNTSVIDYACIEASLKNLPVLRHLRPEFRAQLPVVTPRRPTDGTDQIISPLRRVIISDVKSNTKEERAITSENNISIESKMTVSTVSLTDQQPAAPKVVLPVLDSSISLTNIPKQGTGQDAQETLEKDGHYFKGILDRERERLLALAEKAEAELFNSGKPALPEEITGKFRSAAGKARLLASQKMKQFEGLCQKNINQMPGDDFPTTSDDLAGFWDMVMLQVVQVNGLFEQIERSRKTQWQEILQDHASVIATTQNGNTAKRHTVSASKAKSTANTEAARKTREVRDQMRRQLIQERRRAMRSNAKNSNDLVGIFVPES